jgi:hypothetical protein
MFAATTDVANSQESTQPPTPDAQAHPVTVVTLYSEATPRDRLSATSEKQSRPPIEIVDGGVKSAGGSCWNMDDKGRVTAAPGDCYILRSARPGERPPAQ